MTKGIMRVSFFRYNFLRVHQLTRQTNTVCVWGHSAGYSALCSSQFTSIVREYSIFVGAAVSVTVVNMLLKMLLRSFAGFEKSHTKSDTEKSIAVKIFIAQFFNTALVPLLVYARIESLSETVCRDGALGNYDAANDATFGFNGMVNVHTYVYIYI